MTASELLAALWRDYVASTPQAEAIHLVIEHLLMALLKDDLAGRTTRGG